MKKLLLLVISLLGVSALHARTEKPLYRTTKSAPLKKAPRPEVRPVTLKSKEAKKLTLEKRKGKPLRATATSGGLSAQELQRKFDQLPTFGPGRRYRSFREWAQSTQRRQLRPIRPSF